MADWNRCSKQAEGLPGISEDRLRDHPAFPPLSMSAGLLTHPCFNSNTVEDAAGGKSFRRGSSCGARSAFGSISSVWC